MACLVVAYYAVWAMRLLPFSSRVDAGDVVVGSEIAEAGSETGECRADRCGFARKMGRLSGNRNWHAAGGGTSVHSRTGSGRPTKKEDRVLPAEASWFGKVLNATPADELSPVLNLGSQTIEFRTIAKPHIERELFAPLAARDIRVIHADLKQDEGVEIAGDILEPAVQAAIRKLDVRSVMCNNMLEHVTDIDQVCSALNQICSPGGLLFVSVPNEYPYHPDPIDNGFRPNVAQLAQQLAKWGFELRTSEVVSCGSYIKKVAKNPALLVRDMYLLIVGAKNRDKLRMLKENYRFLSREYQVTCAVFVRSAATI
jgi:SAM-dependent methyltransferase